MTNQEKIRDYLAKAKAAEFLASTYTEGLSREAWLDIAVGYRELARQVPPDCAGSIAGYSPSPRDLCH